MCAWMLRCWRAFCKRSDGMDVQVYHGKLSKRACEELLAEKAMEGAFLIRDSETIQGAMCLCVYKKRVVYTYRILHTHDGYYTLQTSAGMKEKFFKTLEDMIRFYQKKNQGLATRLRHPIKSEKLPESPGIHDDSQDYENVQSDSEYVMVLPS